MRMGSTYRHDKFTIHWKDVSSPVVLNFLPQYIPDEHMQTTNFEIIQNSFGIIKLTTQLVLLTVPCQRDGQYDTNYRALKMAFTLRFRCHWLQPVVTLVLSAASNVTLHEMTDTPIIGGTRPVLYIPLSDRNYVVLSFDYGKSLAYVYSEFVVEGSRGQVQIYSPYPRCIIAHSLHENHILADYKWSTGLVPASVDIGYTVGDTNATVTMQYFVIETLSYPTAWQDVQPSRIFSPFSELHECVSLRCYRIIRRAWSV